MSITKKELQEKFPDLQVFWTWNDVPMGYESKTSLKKQKLWVEGLQPNGVKGNGLSYPYYTFLYKIDLIPDMMENLKCDAHVLEPNPNRIYEYCSNQDIGKVFHWGDKVIIVGYGGLKNNIPCYQVKQIYQGANEAWLGETINGVPQNVLKRV